MNCDQPDRFVRQRCVALLLIVAADIVQFFQSSLKGSEFRSSLIGSIFHFILAVKVHA
jgi:hypothetical protein